MSLQLAEPKADTALWRNANRAAVAFAAWLLFASGAGWAAQSVVVELQDGSRIVGSTDQPALSITTELLGTVSVPFDKVATLRMESGAGKSKVTLTNRDQLQGNLRLDSLAVVAAFGRVTIPLKVVRQLRVIPHGGAAPVIADGLVLYYSFDSDDGEIVRDLSGHDNDGRVAGATYTAKGILGGAYQFNGQSDYLRVRTSESLRSPKFTVNIWVNPGKKFDSGDAGIIGKHKAGDNVSFFLLRGRNQRLGVVLTGDNDSQTFEAAQDREVAVGQWVMLTLTCDGTAAQFYCDGQSCGAGRADGYRGNDYDLVIGTQELSSPDLTPQRFWNGLIGEVRIYDRAVNADEVTALYESVPEHHEPQ